MPNDNALGIPMIKIIIPPIQAILTPIPIALPAAAINPILVAN